MSSKIKSKQAVSIEWQIFRLDLLYELMISYFLATQCFLIRLGEGESHNYGTDYVCSCTYKYKGHAGNCRGLWMTAIAWEILPLFGCMWNCSHYPSTNCLDDQLCPTNDKDCATNCSKAFPSKEAVKSHSFTAPPYRLEEDYQCTAWVQRRGGASDTAHTAPHRNRGAMTTCWLCPLCHTRNQRGRGIFWQKKMPVHL